MRNRVDQLKEESWIGVNDHDVEPLDGLLHQPLLLLPVVVRLPAIQHLILVLDFSLQRGSGDINVNPS